MGKRFEELMLELGRSVRRLVDGPDGSARQAASAPDGEDPGKLKVERTQDGYYRIGGFLFTSEAQAIDFATRRQRRFAQPVPASAPAAVHAKADAAGTIAPALPVSTRTPSQSEQELMAMHGVELAENGGFRAAGYVFTSLDQAISWAKRRRGPSADPGPRLLSQFGPRPTEPLSNQQPARTGLSELLQASSAPAMRQAAQAQNVRWLADQTTFSAGGLTITTDMVPVGKADRYDYHANKALIDPSLKVATQGDPYGSTLSYWPDYRSLDPRARRSYLEWLQGGRTDRQTPIGYVFIFFYGLEYRLLKEGVHDEAPGILGEVRRLLDLFGHHPSFDRYAAALIEVAELLAGEGSTELVPSSELGACWEMPLYIRVALGRKVANGEPLNASDALTWVLTNAQTYLRTPAQRCFTEMKELWVKRYQAAYPDGFKVHIPKARIKHFYRAAGANFTATISLDQLPDVSTLDGPVNRFRPLLQKCVDDLDAYSRFLGRNPEKRDSIAAAILLPTELQDGHAGEQLGARRAQIDQLNKGGTSPTATDVLRLLDLEAPAAGAKVPLATLRQMATTLDLLHVGFEPDRRYGASAPLTAKTKLVLFQCQGGGKVEPDEPAYVAARTMAEIAALAAVSDGIVVPVELEAICRDLASLPGLGDVERQRLAAHAESLLDDPPKRKEAINRLAALPRAVRQRIMHSAVSAILADGRVLPAEVRFLEGLHTTLGLPQEDVYALLHRASVCDDQPVIVAAEVRTPGTPLPSEPGAEAAILQFDTRRLDRIRSETLEVSELLANIFIDEADVVARAPALIAEVSRFEQLDRAHADLLWHIIYEPVPLEAFEAHARSLKLLPEGAIETINEWGFETFDETVIACEEVVYVHEHLVERLRSMGEAV